MVSLSQLTQRASGLIRRAGRDANRMGRFAAGTAARLPHRLRPSGPKPGMDDKTLANKVRTELFRGADAPKGTVDVTVVGGVVELRGEVKNAADMTALETRARAIPEVRDVNNLLHQRKTPASTRADAPGRAKRRSSSPSPAQRTGRQQRITGERKTAGAEPSGADLAAQGAGRKPAPLGAKDTQGDRTTGGGRAGGTTTGSAVGPDRGDS